MYWTILIIAGLLETAFAICLGKAKESIGMVAFWWYLGFFILSTASMLLLMKATEGLPIGTAYAVWTGIGAVGTAIAGIWLFQEAADFWRVFFITTLILSVVGLKYVSN
ncbi:MAG: multidrug efflux SMR transporter [Cytophagaceae bacterium]|jgi:quaternary ammonium compound-resistance protein SugE|nr:multidrug efflux SMR transporter [Cytophagaceae bacterium]